MSATASYSSVSYDTLSVDSLDSTSTLSDVIDITDEMKREREVIDLTLDELNQDSQETQYSDEMELEARIEREVEAELEAEEKFFIEEEEEEKNLIDNTEVIMWINQQHASFIRNKKEEDAWGRALMHAKFPSIPFNKQWAGMAGEVIAKEALTRLGYTVTVPKKIKGLITPDLETEEALFEVKCGTYYTSGTAHQKLDGVPNHYKDTLETLKKPLIILCIGQAEVHARKNTLLADYRTMKKGFTQEYLELCAKYNISYVGLSDLLAKGKQ
jgi:hypothetical protein